MSYDLTVRLKRLDDTMIPQWISEINKFNMRVEVYPKFTFSDHSGFLPFKVVNYDCPNPRFNNIELLTGYELDIQRMSLVPVKKSFVHKWFSGNNTKNTDEEIQSNAEIEVTFSISIQDSFEFRIGWYSAAALAMIGDGVLIDHQEGIEVQGNRLIRHAYDTVLQDEKTIKEDEWKVHEFDEWKE
ncbi:hypothetical protein [Cohnella sp. JJ-181]|uniref:hypothetical protein n=1 Tax=Cohnella rhizoplanae TaxID=2974897 RepID=UPI0022FF6756|nr:hypothetical protein [Cohnella sp. JJ-181]CAI6087323.1 hypothetical protein COHCIP112018_05450 [Cohnella sp. JJ-181]